MKKIIILSLIILSLIIIGCGSKTSSFEEYKKTENINNDSNYIGNSSKFNSEKIKEYNPGNYIFTSNIPKAYDKIINESESFKGFQKRYYWKQLEPRMDEYDFSSIKEDLNFVKSIDKELFIQLQMKTFKNYDIAIPDYLLTENYSGGVYYYSTKKGDKGTNGIIWDDNFRLRYIKLVKKLGDEFDNEPYIEGINFPETVTSINIDEINSQEQIKTPITQTNYVESIGIFLNESKKSFPKSTIIQYVNFLPNSDHIKPLFDFLIENKIGVGGPDTFVKPGKLLQITYKEVPRAKGKVPIGYAVQWSNYDEGSVNEIYNFNKNILVSDYTFWLDREPFFIQEVIPLIRTNLK